MVKYDSINCLVKIGNFKEELLTVYNKCCFQDLSWYYTSEIPEVIALENTFFKKLGWWKNKSWKKSRTSFFERVVIDPENQKWHFDGKQDICHQLQVVIASYPYPTQFILNKNGTVQNLERDFSKTFQEMIEDKIKSGGIYCTYTRNWRCLFNAT